MLSCDKRTVEKAKAYIFDPKGRELISNRNKMQSRTVLQTIKKYTAAISIQCIPHHQVLMGNQSVSLHAYSQCSFLQIVEIRSHIDTFNLPWKESTIFRSIIDFIVGTLYCRHGTNGWRFLFYTRSKFW